MPETFDGIAHGAALWSGAFATGWTGERYSADWNLTAESIYSVCVGMMLEGHEGQTPHVINNSWGASSLEFSAGYDASQIGIDALIQSSGTILVASTGNDGPGSDTLGGLAAGFNSIGVGADTDTLDGPPALGPPQEDPLATLDDLNGTSFSGPIISRSAALVADAGLTHFAANPEAVDPRVRFSLLRPRRA